MDGDFRFSASFGWFSSVNNRVAPIGKAGIQRRKKYSAALNNVHMTFLGQRRKKYRGRRPLEGPVSVRMYVRFPSDSRERDVTNYVKLTHDALEGVAYVSDSQVVHAEQFEVKEAGEALVWVHIFPASATVGADALRVHLAAVTVG